jgi:hypothetical protein
MNRNLALAVVRSLAVTGPSAERLGRFKTFSIREWRRTFAWLDDSGLALKLLDAVDRTGAADVLPPRVTKKLRVRLASNRQRLARMKQEFDSLNRAFERAGVDYAVLKGFSLMPEYWLDASLRSQYDYDYLVHPRSLEIAKQVLETAGLYEKSQSPGLDPQGATLFVGEPLDYSASGEEWYSLRIPRRVELHLSLWEHDRDAIRVQTPQDALERKRYACWDGLHFPVLADDDALIFQCLHAFHHILDYWCRPSCFLEIARFIAGRASDQDFWDRLRSRVGGHSYLPEIAGLVFRLASELFGAPIPGRFSLGGASRRSRALDLWVRRYGTDWSLALFPGSKLSLFLHREFVEDPAAWSDVWRSRLLPFHRPARVAEPRESSLKLNWKAKWQQWRFVAARFRYHFAGLVAYAWHVRGWTRMLRRRVGSGELGVGSRPTEEGFSRLPTADCLLPASADRRLPTEKEPAR